MARRAIPFVACVGVLGVICATAPAAPPVPSWDECSVVDPITGETHIDPDCFFGALVERYRGIAVYEDVSRVRQVTQRRGEAPHRVETSIGCAITDGELRVGTPLARMRTLFGLDLPFRTDGSVDDAVLKYNIWLAPHMALKFEEEPARNFRSGVVEGFTATDVETVKVGDRSMVHLELKSCEEKGEPCSAQFDLYINPESMLVEHIKGHQLLPDGAEYQTTLDIRPTVVESVDTTPADPVEPVEARPVSTPPLSSPPLSPPPGARPGGAMPGHAGPHTGTPDRLRD
jgi:hypothetical protein